jgi:hypothetical protein
MIYSIWNLRSSTTFWYRLGLIYDILIPPLTKVYEYIDKEKASPTESPLRFCEGEKVLTEKNLFITIEPDNKEPL